MKGLLTLAACAALLVPWRYYANAARWLVTNSDDSTAKALRGSCVAIWDGRKHPHHILAEAGNTLRRARNCARDGNPFRMYGRHYMVTAVESGDNGWTMRIYGHELGR